MIHPKSVSRIIEILMFLVLMTPMFPAQAKSPLEDVQLKIQFYPLEHRLVARTELTWEAPQETFTFLLNSKLTIAPSQDYELTPITNRGLAQIYQMKFKKPLKKVLINYQGEINEPIKEGESPGIITEDGISLLSESYWHPTFKDEAPWTLEVEFPNSEWKAMMPGVMTDLGGNRFRFQSYIPTNEWALVADRFHVFKTTSASGKLIQVWLKSDDSELAQSYLDLVPGYIDYYSKILGSFPFSGYTVIENSLETGYAFPGFTLLGPSVIRLPFLLRSSLPHEILHSWWGNSVLVDYERGNWCEGLTTYMADHAFAIQDGKGPEYRRASLQNFQDFVTKDRDFPLRRFVSRNDRGTQAVGYGKSMMLFQMLENYLSSDVFYGALSRFSQQNKWKPMGYDDVQKNFEAYTNKSLDFFFGPWLDQLGAPKISILDLKLIEGAEPSILLTVKQEITKGEKPYVLPLRVKVLYQGGYSHRLLFTLDQMEKTFSIPISAEAGGAKPQKIWVDPDFEVFRTLYDEETPFAMSKILVDRETVTVSVPVAERDSYDSWIQSVKGLYGKPLKVLTDDEPLPAAGPLWIIGNNNAHAKLLDPTLKNRQINIIDNQLTYETRTWYLNQSAVFVGESIHSRPVVWVWTDKNQPAPLLMQKIKHYTSFSIVSFTNQKNDFKQTWPILNSPLIRTFL